MGEFPLAATHWRRSENPVFASQVGEIRHLAHPSRGEWGEIRPPSAELAKFTSDINGLSHPEIRPLASDP